MRCVTFHSGPWPRSSLVGRALSRILPSANPDFDSTYERVESWWLELDETSAVCRELAFDASGATVAAAPLGENLGIFTDLGSAPEGLGDSVDASEFERTWQRFEEEWRKTSGAPRAV